MTLTWTESGTNVEAFGTKGCYVIKRAPGFSGCILTAVGHDELPMLALPPYGRSFGAMQHAKDYAARLDRVSVPEPQGGVG